MKDLAGLRAAGKRADSQRKGGGGGSGDFPYIWMSIRDLDRNGLPYKFRILPPHPDKCSRGARLYINHTITKDPMGQEKQKVLCSECYNPDQGCFFCDLIEALDDAGVGSDLPEGVWEHIYGDTDDRNDDGMRAQKEYLFPTIWMVEETKEDRISRAGNPYKKTVIKPNTNKLKLAVFKVDWESAMDRLEALDKKFGDALTSEHGDGRWLTITRNHNSLTINADHEPSPLNAPQLMKKYPGIDSFGKKKQMGYERQEALCKSCWWWEHVAEHVEWEEEDE